MIPFTAEELKANFALLPQGQGVIMLMRHSIRHEIPEDETYGFQTFLTRKGVTVAEAFGPALPYPITYTASSPLTRCIQTAQALSKDQIERVEIVVEPLIGASSAYIIELEPAGEYIDLHGGIGFVNALISGKYLAGMNHVEAANQLLLKMFQRHPLQSETIHLYTTHDSVLGPFVYSIFKRSEVDEKDWPKVLESCLIWFEEDKVNVIWRGQKTTVNL